MKRGGPMLWLILAVAAGLSIPPVTMIVNELTHPVPEINPLFIGGVALLWLVAVWAPAALCIAVPRQFVRVPILLLMLVPYVVWIQRDAVLLAQVPTTAIVNRAEAEAKVKVVYAGDPQFKLMEGTSLGGFASKLTSELSDSLG